MEQLSFFLGTCIPIGVVPQALGSMTIWPHEDPPFFQVWRIVSRDFDNNFGVDMLGATTPKIIRKESEPLTGTILRCRLGACR